MDIPAVRVLLERLKQATDLYYSFDTQKTAIDGQTAGVLTVNGVDVSVTGTDFDDLLAAEIVLLDANIVSANVSMQDLVDSLDVLI
jgi:hypothetical protein